MTQAHPSQAIQIAEIRPGGGQGGGGLFRQGERVSFRVLDALPLDRYRIALRHHRFVVTSRIPLTVGQRYAAQVAVREGRILLVYQTTGRGLMELLWSHGGQPRRSLASIFQSLSSLGLLPSNLTAGGHTAEAVRVAILHGGLFYEAKLRDWMQKGEALQPLQDLKGFLLAQLREGGSSLRDVVEAALRQLEGRQIATLQAGTEAALPLCLPFGEQMFIEGFLKRAPPSSGSGLVVALRVPFPDGEEVLVVISWSPGEVDVSLSAGERAQSLFRSALPGLEEQLGGLGLNRVHVRLAGRLPRQLRQLLKGSGFLDAYG